MSAPKAGHFSNKSFDDLEREYKAKRAALRASPAPAPSPSASSRLLALAGGTPPPSKAKSSLPPPPPPPPPPLSTVSVVSSSPISSPSNSSWSATKSKSASVATVPSPSNTSWSASKPKSDNRSVTPSVATVPSASPGVGADASAIRANSTNSAGHTSSSSTKSASPKPLTNGTSASTAGSAPPRIIGVTAVPPSSSRPRSASLAVSSTSAASAKKTQPPPSSRSPPPRSSNTKATPIDLTSSSASSSSSSSQDSNKKTQANGVSHPSTTSASATTSSLFANSARTSTSQNGTSSSKSASAQGQTPVDRARAAASAMSHAQKKTQQQQQQQQGGAAMRTVSEPLQNLFGYATLGLGDYARRPYKRLKGLPEYPKPPVELEAFDGSENCRQWLNHAKAQWKKVDANRYKRNPTKKRVEVVVRRKKRKATDGGGGGASSDSDGEDVLSSLVKKAKPNGGVFDGGSGKGPSPKKRKKLVPAKKPRFFTTRALDRLNREYVPISETLEDDSKLPGGTFDFPSFRVARLPLVAKEFGLPPKHVGDLLMISDFLLAYRDLLCFDTKLRCVELACEISELSPSVLVQDTIIAFLRVLIPPLFEAEGKDPKQHPITYLTWPHYLAQFMRHERKLTERAREQEAKRLASLPKGARERQEEASDVFRDWCFNARHVRETEGGRFFTLDYQSRLKTVLKLLDSTISSEDIRLDLFASAGDLNKAHGDVEKFGRSLVAQLKEELNSKEDALFATSRALGTALGKMDALIDARAAASRQKTGAASVPLVPVSLSVPPVVVHHTDTSGFKVPNPPSTPSAPSPAATTPVGVAGEKGVGKMDPTSSSSSSSTTSSSSVASSTKANGKSTLPTASAKKSEETSAEIKSSENGSEEQKSDTSKPSGTNSETGSDKSKTLSAASASTPSAAPKAKAPTPKTPVVNGELIREWQEFASDAYIVSKLRAIEREKMKKEFTLKDTQASGAVSREPLGYDRFRRVYWRVRGCQDTVFIQITPEAMKAMLAAGSASGQLADDGRSEWRCIRTRGQFNSLCGALNPEGSREHRLLNALQCFTWTFSNIRRKSIRLHTSRRHEKDESGGGGKDADDTFRMYPRYVTKREMRGARATLDANTDYAWKKNASEKEKASTNAATPSCDSSVSSASSVESSSANADAKSATNDADGGEVSAEQRQLQDIDKLRKQLESLAHKRAHKKGLSELNCLKLLLLDVRRNLHTRSVASSSLPSLERLMTLLKRESSRTDEPPPRFDLCSPWAALDSVRTAMSILLAEITEKWTCPWFDRQKWHTKLADARHIHEVAALLFDLDKAIIYSPNSYRTIHAKYNKMKAAAQDEKKDDGSLLSSDQTRPDRCQVCQLDVALKRDHLIMCFECDCEWHTDCLDPPLHFVPEELWRCPKCSAAAATLSDADGEKNAAFGPKVAQIVASFEHKSSTSSKNEPKSSTSSMASDHQAEATAKDVDKDAAKYVPKKPASATSAFSGWAYELQRLEKSMNAERKQLDMQLRKRARENNSAAARGKKRRFSALSALADSEHASRSVVDLSDSDNDAHGATSSREKPSSKSALENAVAEFLRSSLDDPEHPRNVKRRLLLSAREMSKAQNFRASPRSRTSALTTKASATSSAISRSSSFRASNSSVRCTGGQPSKPLSFFENDAHLACCLVCARPLIPSDSTPQAPLPRPSPSVVTPPSSASATAHDEKQSAAANSVESKSAEVNTAADTSLARSSSSRTPPRVPDSDEPFLRCTATGCNDGVSFPTAVHKSCYYEFRSEWRQQSASRSALRKKTRSSSAKAPSNRFYDDLEDDPLIVLGERLKCASEGGEEMNAELAWKCDQCRRHTDLVRCELCHHSKGIFQQVEPRSKPPRPSLACVDAKTRHWKVADYLPTPEGRDKWVHRVCALWHPNLRLERHTSYLGESRELVCGLDGARKEQPLPGACEFCCRSDGFRLSCSHPGCTKSHHVMCLILVGVHSGCFIEERIAEGAAVAEDAAAAEDIATAAGGAVQVPPPEDADVKMTDSEDADVKMTDCEDAAARPTSTSQKEKEREQGASQKANKVASSPASDKGNVGENGARQSTGVSSSQRSAAYATSDRHSAAHVDSKDEEEKSEASPSVDTSNDPSSVDGSQRDVDMRDVPEVSSPLSPPSKCGVSSSPRKSSRGNSAESVPVRRSWCCEHGPLRAAARASSSARSNASSTQ